MEDMEDMSSQEITADFATLMRQSWQTAHEYLSHAIEEIDGELGKGYAAKHPELIAAFMKVAAMDFSTACIGLSAQQARAVEYAKLEQMERISE